MKLLPSSIKNIMIIFKNSKNALHSIIVVRKVTSHKNVHVILLKLFLQKLNPIPSILKVLILILLVRYLKVHMMFDLQIEM